MQPVPVAVMLVRDGAGNRYCPACGEHIERGSDEPAVHAIDGRRQLCLCRDCGVKVAPWSVSLVGKPQEKRFVWLADAPPPLDGEVEVEFVLTRKLKLPATSMPIAGALPIKPIPIRRRK